MPYFMSLQQKLPILILFAQASAQTKMQRMVLIHHKYSPFEEPPPP